jgi:hypothetical protein
MPLTAIILDDMPDAGQADAREDDFENQPFDDLRIAIQEVAENPPKCYTNHYNCDCGASWRDEWSCQCDDRCPLCNTSCSPTHSENMAPEVSEPNPVAAVERGAGERRPTLTIWTAVTDNKDGTQVFTFLKESELDAFKHNWLMERWTEDHGPMPADFWEAYEAASYDQDYLTIEASELDTSAVWHALKAGTPGAFGVLYDPNEITTMLDGNEIVDSNCPKDRAAMLKWCQLEGGSFEDAMSELVWSNVPTSRGKLFMSVATSNPPISANVPHEAFDHFQHSTCLIAAEDFPAAVEVLDKALAIHSDPDLQTLRDACAIRRQEDAA